MIKQQRNILEYLEETAGRFPSAAAYCGAGVELSWKEVYDKARALGTFLLKAPAVKPGPVLVYMDKSPLCITAFMGILESGSPYVPLDTAMPEARVELIARNLKPSCVVTVEALKERAKAVFESLPVVLLEEALNEEPDGELLKKARERVLDIDPAYILYTSGSTGVPKGVVVSHRSLIDYIDNFTADVGINEEDVIAGQAPFYFDASLIDIYCAMKSGAAMHIVPLPLFSQPLKLMEFLEEHRVSVIRWVPSALSIVSTFRALDSLKPSSLRLIIFGAESMPVKCFDYWQSHYDDSAEFIQIYGPTEITGICTLYHVPRGYKAGGTIPIGRSLANCDVFLLDEENRPVTKPGETGEICVRGTCLANGYYNDRERTEAVFVRNPLNSAYNELIYKTGDLASYNEEGELVFASRKDFQIKHMGHRIELGEIESAAIALPGMKAAVCFFDEKKNKIHMAYTAQGYEDSALLAQLSEKLPRYMIPNVLHCMDEIPATATGKADRVKLKEEFL